MESPDAPAGETLEDQDDGEAEEACREPPSSGARQRGQGTRLQGLHVQIRRGRPGRAALRRRGAGAAARLSRQAAEQPVERRGAARQPPAAPPHGAAEPRLGVRPRGGHARPRAPVARGDRPPAAAVLQAREGHRLPRHCGDAAARQFGLDARDVPSRWRPPAPTSWRARWSAAASRSRSWASPPRPGRAASRARPGCSPASPRRRGGSTTCATSSTRRRTRPGAGRAATSA